MSLSLWFKKTFGKEKPVRCKPRHGEDRATGPEALHVQKALPTHLARAIHAFTGVQWTDRGPYEEAQKQMVQAITQTSPELCSCNDWQILYRHLIRHGYFRPAIESREKALQCAVKRAASANSHVLDLHRAFTAAIDQADFSAAREYLERVIRSRRLRKRDTHEMQAYLELNTGKLQSPDYRQLLVKVAPISGFYRALTGQSVALVGPASSEQPHGAEIDSFDRVVRPNFSGHQTYRNASESGSRTDIGVYANGIVKMTDADKEDGQFGRWVADLDWAVIKNPRLKLHPQLVASGKVVVAPRDELMFHGTPTLIPVAIHTLLIYGAKRVKVFNANFHFSAQPYAAYYHPELVATVGTQLTALFRSMAGHDFLSQVHFVRNLARAGLIELSPETREVVELGSRGYLEGLERIFVFPGLT